MSLGRTRYQTKKSWQELDNKRQADHRQINIVLAWSCDTDGPPMHTTASVVLADCEIVLPINQSIKVYFRHKAHITHTNTHTQSRQTEPRDKIDRNIKTVTDRNKNKKLRYREEHSASVVLSWCTLTFIGRQTTDQQLINHLYETGHETYRIPRNNAK